MLSPSFQETMLRFFGKSVTELHRKARRCTPVAKSVVLSQLLKSLTFMILASTPEDIQEAMNNWIVYLISYPMLKPKEAEVMEI